VSSISGSQLFFVIYIDYIDHIDLICYKKNYNGKVIDNQSCYYASDAVKLVSAVACQTIS
jgi:hypothetical protein